MNVHTAVNNVSNLTTAQLQQAIRQCDLEISSYGKRLENYPIERKIHCGLPYMAKLKLQRRILACRLEDIEDEPPILFGRLKKKFMDESIPHTIRKGGRARIEEHFVYFIDSRGKVRQVPDGYSACELSYSRDEFEPIEEWFDIERKQ